MPFNNETLRELIDMVEGPALDFKREQYRYNKANERDKSKLLKDILAFANTPRYRTAYILIGVAEVKGRQSQVVGVEEHLDDAILHQFVNSKTNRPAEFTYRAFPTIDGEIGVISIPIQTGPIYVTRKFGIVEANTVYVRDGSSTRPASPDEIADVRRTNPPRLVEWSINRLRTLSKNAVMDTAEQWQRHPHREDEYDLGSKRLRYPDASDWVVRMVRNRDSTLNGYPDEMDSYSSLHWVFKNFEQVAICCTHTIRTIGPALIESGALLRAIAEMEDDVGFEKKVWDEFLLRAGDPRTPLPGEAHYNLLTVAVRTVYFIEVLDDEDGYRNPEHPSLSRNGRSLFQRSKKWGHWR